MTILCDIHIAVNEYGLAKTLGTGSGSNSGGGGGGGSRGAGASSGGGGLDSGVVRLDLLPQYLSVLGPTISELGVAATVDKLRVMPDPPVPDSVLLHVYREDSPGASSSGLSSGVPPVTDLILGAVRCLAWGGPQGTQYCCLPSTVCP